jgi:uncharacterized protein YggU (UPF0235/DUF167 family)
MTRSLKKGPFVTILVAKPQRPLPIKTKADQDLVALNDLARFIGLTIAVHNGKQHCRSLSLIKWLATSWESLRSPARVTSGQKKSQKKIRR